MVNKTSQKQVPLDHTDLLSSIHGSNVKVGIRPLPLTSAFVNSDSALVSNFQKLGYDYVLLPITNARYRENCKQYFQGFKEKPNNSSNKNTTDLNSLNVSFPNLTEVNILTGLHTSNTIGLLSSWVELDSYDTLINEFSLQVIFNEISYASYLGLSTVLIAPPKDLSNLSIFTNNLNYLLTQFPMINISISLPICEDYQINSITGDTIPIMDPLSTWDFWNTIRIQCNYNSNLSVSLGSPKQNIPQSVVNRWLLEPIKFYLVSSSRFIPNSKNYPVLNKFNQLIIWKIIQSKALNPPVLLLHGVDKENDLMHQEVEHEEEDRTRFVRIKINDRLVYLGDMAYLNYLRHICATSKQNNQLLPIQNFTINNLLLSNIKEINSDPWNSSSSLQMPLQPLNHNLNNVTYKIFEKDQVKYDSYERAIVAALMDLIRTPRFQHIKKSNDLFHLSRLSLQNSNDKLPTPPPVSSQNTNSSNQQQQPSFNNNNKSNDCLTYEFLKILIIGPGRGPLIEKVFSAIKFLNLDKDKIRIITIEKNPNVMIYLNQRNSQYWDSKVEIINEDVRNWIPTNPNCTGFHLVISELLGSFGCNELSPECLDSIQQYCDLQNSIFIPKEYSSYIAPAISPSIYKKISSLNDYSKLHTLFIPLVDQIDTLSSKYGKLWTFQHTLKTSQNNNANETSSSTTLMHNQHPMRKINHNKHNKRIGHTTLKCHRKGTIHGLIGYFEAELYNGITISNCPTGHGPQPHNLVSWLPCFFPLESPIHVPDDQEVSIFMKRDTNGDKIWYEWCVETFMYLAVPSSSSSAISSYDQTRSINTSIVSTSNVINNTNNNSIIGNNSYNNNNHNHNHSQSQRNSRYEQVEIDAHSQLVAPEMEITNSQKTNNGSINPSADAFSPSSHSHLEDEECQIRVRTGISKIHNPNGQYYNLKL